MKYRISTIARVDIRNAKKWFDKQRRGLGKQFTDAVDSTIQKVLAFPEAYEEIKPGYRRAMVGVFSYTLTY